MAEQIYYSVFTKQGLALLTEAIQNGTKLGITSMAFGDGGGSLPVPNENFTSMVREVHRTQLNSLAPDPNNANWLRADAIIASATGGFNIRELGLYAGNVLVAYSNYPSTYKPNPSDGTARIMSFRMILQIDNTANFDLVIDPDVVLATIQKVEDAKLEIYQKTVAQVESISDLLKLTPTDGMTVYVKSYYSQNKYKGGGTRIYVASRKDENDGFLNINGWVLLPQNNTITPEQAGAFSDGINDDTIGCRKAIEYAYTIGLTVEFMSNATYIVNDKLLNVDESASTVASTKSFTLKGNNCRMKLGGLAGDFIITVILPSVAQNNNKFTIQDFFFYTDNTTRPSVFYFKNASWISLSNAVFFQTWIGAKFELGLRNDVNNCSFWGNSIGLYYQNTRDSAVSQTHAFSCEKGLVASGDSDVATDGNLSLTDFTANACSEKGIELSGLYTPQFNNIIVEHCDIGIDYRSCQFGHLSNIFIGPCNRYSFYSDKKDNGINNDYTQISNLNIQNEATLRYMNFSQVINISAQRVDKSISGGVIYVTNSFELEIVMPKIRDSTIYNGILVEVDAADVNVLGGKVNNHITYTGESYGSVLGTQVGGDVHFGSGNMKSNVSYLKMIDGVLSIIDKLFVKYGTISGNSVLTLNASDFCKTGKSSAIITAGVMGSMTVAEIVFIKNNETIVGTVISNAGNRGSAIIEVINSNSLDCAIKISATTATEINYQIER